MSAINSTSRALFGADSPKARLNEDARMHRLSRGKVPLKDSIQALYRKVELADLLLFFYLLALSRQYFWGVGNNVLAWILSFTFAFSLSCFGLSKKEDLPQSDRLSYSFYLIVVLPLFVIYASRFVFPDISFDVLNYHILAGERSLRGWPTGASDYYPFPTFNPLPDILTGIYRHLLGYRLGTIVNYLALIWAATILVKFLRSYLKKTWLICIGVLLLFLTEGLLFEINNYMVDLLALPLLLQATHLVVYQKQPKVLGYSQFYTAFLLGLSVALKLSNAFFVIPILLIWALRLLAVRFKLSPVRLILLLVFFFVPLIPHSIYLHRVDEPVIPFLSNVVKSPLGFTTIKEGRWGAVGPKQALIWPVQLYSKTPRVSEFAVYAGKIPLGFVLAFFFLPFRRVDRNIRALSFIMIVGALIWSLASGYTRYASYLELISGVLLIYLSRFVAENLKIRDSLRRVLSLIPWCVLGALSCLSLSYVNRYEWSMRPTLIESYWGYREESLLVLGDYSLKSFLAPDKAALFEDVEVWITYASLNSGFQGLLRPDVPVISLRNYTSFSTPKTRAQFDKAFQEARNKRMFTLCYYKDLDPTVDSISNEGFGIGKTTPVSLPFYSRHTVYTLALIEILPPSENGSKSSPTVKLTSRRPLPTVAYTALLVSPDTPTSLNTESKVTLYITVKNLSNVVWPGRVTNGLYNVNLGNHWLDKNENMLITDDGRAGLPFDLNPNEEVQMPLTITAPTTPGNYILELDLVQEQVAWFGTMGSQTLRIPIKVE